MALTVRVDKQGRLILPKEVRDALEIGEESKLTCNVVGNRVILEKFSQKEIEEAVQRLREIIPNLDFDSVEVEDVDKYLDREYALRKIGLRRSG